jgi:DNA (cytosine-5)-methyltransferase 1
MRLGSLCSGIGGLELGLERALGCETIWQVELEPHCRAVLAAHWPNAKRFDDVLTVGSHNLDPVDLICFGSPCQDLSSAGKRAGLNGPKSRLFYECARVVSELRPEWVVIENVASGASRWVDAMRSEMERRGYASLPVPIAASDCGAPHRRTRIFLVAHADRATVRNESGGGQRAEQAKCATRSSNLRSGGAASFRPFSRLIRRACAIGQVASSLRLSLESATSWRPA